MNNYFQSADRAEFQDLINRATWRYRGWNCITIRNGNGVLGTENFLQGQVRTINNLNANVVNLTQTVTTQARTIAVQGQTILQHVATIAHLTADNATLRASRDTAVIDLAARDATIARQGEELETQGAQLAELTREIDAMRVDLGILTSNSVAQQSTIDATCNFLEREDVRRALYRDHAVPDVEDFVSEVLEQGSPDRPGRLQHAHSGDVVPYPGGDDAATPPEGDEDPVADDDVGQLEVAPVAPTAHAAHAEVDVTDNEWTEPAFSPIRLDKYADDN